MRILLKCVKKESIEFEESAPKILALNAGGSFRDSLSLLEKQLHFHEGLMARYFIRRLCL